MEDLFAEEESFDVSLYDISYRHDIRNLVVRTLLTYLELDGYLEAGTPFYSSYKFHPLRSSAEILSQFEGERREFLANLFRQAKPGKKWFTLELDQTFGVGVGSAAHADDCDADLVVQILSTNDRRCGDERSSAGRDCFD